MKEFIKKLLKKLKLDNFYKTLSKTYNSFYWKEKRVKGKKSDKKYYVIRRSDEVGLFSYFNTHIGAIKKAVDKGYVPIIDMQTYENTYLIGKDVNKYNSWEFFFKQPMNVSVSDVKAYTRVISAGTVDYDCPNDSDECMNVESEKFKMWKRYVNRYIKYSDEAEKVIDETYKRLINPDDKVLGVKCRGTDYNALKPVGHPIQPEAEEVILKAEGLIKDKGYTKIFLATEDKKIWKAFKEKFGDIVISNVIEYEDYKDGVRISSLMPHSTEYRLNDGMNYLVSMAILSMCSGFIAGKTSGAVSVLLLSKGFEYYYIWDKGRY